MILSDYVRVGKIFWFEFFFFVDRDRYHQFNLFPPHHLSACNSIEIVSMRTNTLTVNFATLLAVTHCCTFISSYYEDLKHRTRADIADFTYFIRETEFLKVLFQLSLFDRNGSQVPLLTDTTLQSLMKWVFRRVKGKLPRKEPLQNVFIQPITFTERGLDFNGTFEDVIIDRLSTIELDYVKSLSKNRTVEFGYKIPRIETRDTAYELDGKIYGIRVRGRGLISVNVTGVEVKGTGRYSLNRWKHRSLLHFKEMGVQYSLDDFKIQISGLEVPAIIQYNFNSILSSMMTAYLQEQRKIVSGRVSEVMRIVLNKFIKESPVREKLRLIWEWII